MRCKHYDVEHERDLLDFDGRILIAHKFPCQGCEAEALIWDDDVDYSVIED